MKRLILHNRQSPGDILMLTAAVRDLHKCHPGEFQTDVRTSCPALWENNPYITPLDEKDPTVTHIESHYPLVHESNTTGRHFLWGFIDHLNAELGTRIKLTEFKGDIHLSSKERSQASPIHRLLNARIPYWIIVAGGKHDYTIKWWRTSRFQQVVDYFRGRIQFVQVGVRDHFHPVLDNVISLVGETNLRNLIPLARHADGVLCPVTFMMHLAAAVPPVGKQTVSRPCVVVAGGREPPHWEAYPHHQFIHTVGTLSCCSDGGCWRARTVRLGDRDEKDHRSRLCKDVVDSLPRCMDMISAREVARRIAWYMKAGVRRYLKEGEAGLAQPFNRRSLLEGMLSRRAQRRPPPTEVPIFSVCVLTYGNHPDLARRCIESVRRYTDRSYYRLVVGANAVCRETEQYLRRLKRTGAIDRLHFSRKNIGKCPMMRRMFKGIDTQFICWLDDDSYLTDPRILHMYFQLIEQSPADVVQWGCQAFCRRPADFTRVSDVTCFVNTAPWSRGLAPPSSAPRGALESQWHFILGGFWIIRTKVVRQLDWPDRRLLQLADDVLLGEAIRQHGLRLQNTSSFGVAIDQAPRRAEEAHRV